MKRFTLWSGLLTAFFAMPCAFANNAKFANGIEAQVDAGHSQPILIHLRARANLSGVPLQQSKTARGNYVYRHLRRTAESSQQAVRQLLDHHGIHYHAYYLVNVIAADAVPAKLVVKLAGMPEVAKISSNKPFKALPTLGLAQSRHDEKKGVGSNIAAIGADKVWEMGFTGEGMVVAGNDTGIDWEHPALKSKYRGFDGDNVNHDYNWHDGIREALDSSTNDCGVKSAVPCDDHGHGTHTLGTIVGDDGNGNQIGVAPGAQWMGCRNMYNGTGTPATYIECFEFFLAPYPVAGNSFTDGDPSKAPHIINNSWGCPASENCLGDELKPMLEALNAAGIMVVAAAGNDGSGCGTITDAPAKYADLVLSVGAVSHNTNTIAYFSSRGPTFEGKIGPHVSAPGVSIRSATPGGNYEGGLWSGTSMAAPHVAGLVALLWQAQPHLVGQNAETIEAVKAGANAKEAQDTCGDGEGSRSPNNHYGWGIIDAEKTVNEVGFKPIL